VDELAVVVDDGVDAVVLVDEDAEVDGAVDVVPEGQDEFGGSTCGNPDAV
jgi:hypothetical protein